MLDQPLAIFRGEDGSPTAILDRCPHRGAPLSAGRVEEGCIRCPYHGWRLDVAGACVEIPGLPKAPAGGWPGVKHFHTREMHGLIWIRMDPEGESKPVISAGLSDRERFSTVVWTAEAEGELLDVLENFLDATHTHYVHSGLIRRRDGDRRPVTARVRMEPGKVEARYLGEGKQTGFISRLFERERTESVGRFLLPSIAELEYRSKRGAELLITAYLTPESDTRQRIHAVIGLRRGRAPGWLKHWLIAPFFRKALRQDLQILKRVRRSLDGSENREFRSTELDFMRPAIRRLLHDPAPPIEEREVVLWL